MYLKRITVSTNPFYNVYSWAVMSAMEVLWYLFVFVYFSVSLHPVKLTSSLFIGTFALARWIIILFFLMLL